MGWNWRSIFGGGKTEAAPTESAEVLALRQQLAQLTALQHQSVPAAAVPAIVAAAVTQPLAASDIAGPAEQDWYTKGKEFANRAAFDAAISRSAITHWLDDKVYQPGLPNTGAAWWTQTDGIRIANNKPSPAAVLPQTPPPPAAAGGSGGSVLPNEIRYRPNPASNAPPGLPTQDQDPSTGQWVARFYPNVSSANPLPSQVVWKPDGTPDYLLYFEGNTYHDFAELNKYKADLETTMARRESPDFNRPLDGMGAYPVSRVTQDDATFLESCVLSGKYDMMLFYKVLDGSHRDIADKVETGLDHVAGFNADTYQGPMRNLVIPFAR